MADTFRIRYPRLAALMDESEGDVLAYLGWSEQARHALPVEPVSLSVRGPLWGSCLPGSLSRRLAEEHHGAEQLVRALLWKLRK